MKQDASGSRRRNSAESVSRTAALVDSGPAIRCPRCGLRVLPRRNPSGKSWNIPPHKIPDRTRYCSSSDAKPMSLGYVYETDSGRWIAVRYLGRGNMKHMGTFQSECEARAALASVSGIRNGSPCRD